MADIVLPLDRLKAQLLTSGLSQQNQALFQVINQLIDYVRQGQVSINQVFVGNSIGSFTKGSVVFADTSGVLTQDNANLFWNDILDILRIRTGGITLDTIPGISLSSSVLKLIGYDGGGIAKTSTIGQIWDAGNAQSRLSINGPAANSFIYLFDNGTWILSSASNLINIRAEITNDFADLVLRPVHGGISVVVRGISTQTEPLFIVRRAALQTGNIQEWQTNTSVALVVIDPSGQLGIGIAIPTAYLHIKAGTTSFVPFKFTSGPLATIPQIGAIEYDGTFVYWTDNLGVRRPLNSTIPGPMGIPGSDGENGEDGLPGVTGPAGMTGLQGPIGIAGPQGISGNDGLDGEDGLPGTQGPQGFAGTNGINGAPGISGISGVDGEDGLDGFPGSPGINGVAGLTGPIGSIGISGVDGEDGIDGFPGSIGTQGIQGLIGVQGPSGIDGEDGSDGFQGPQGIQGLIGPIGPIGIPGVDAEEPQEPMIIPGPIGPAGVSGSGGLTLTSFTKDLGVARRSGTFDITGLSGLIANKNVLVIQTMEQIATKGNARDEAEMDLIDLTGYVVDAATIRVNWHAPSTVVGTYAFGYAVSA